ncbi:MAG: rod shape-determining protein MreC, partial [Fidelibacterota bacterium]
MRYLINVTLRYKSQISFFLTLFISIILYTNNSTTQVLYIRTQFSDIARWILQPASHLQYLVSVEEENALLRASEIQLRLQLESMHYLQRENERLHALLGFRDENPLNLIPAKIISKGIKSSVQSAIIDVGTQNGVRDNSGVLSTRGVVGKVISAGERSAIVEL